jgi:hypothetical protein
LSNLITRYEIEKGEVIDAMEEGTMTAEKLWGGILSKDEECECGWKVRTPASCAQCVNLRRMGNIGQHSFNLGQQHFEIVRERITTEPFIETTPGLGILHTHLSSLPSLTVCQPELKKQLTYQVSDAVTCRLLNTLNLSRDDLMTAFICGQDASFVYTSRARSLTEEDIPALVGFFKSNESKLVTLPHPHLEDLQVRELDGKVVARCSNVNSVVGSTRLCKYDEEAQNFVASMSTLKGVDREDYVIGIDNLNAFLAMRRMGVPVMAGSFDLYVLILLLLSGKKKCKNYKKLMEALFPDKELVKEVETFLSSSHEDHEVYEFLSEIKLQCDVLSRLTFLVK